MDTRGQEIVLNGFGQGLEYHIERAPPKVVISKRLEYLEKFESHVEKYDRYQSLEMYKKSCHAVAKDRFHDFHNEANLACNKNDNATNQNENSCKFVNTKPEDIGEFTRDST